jgi:Mg-chelatase subunit ChlD
MVLSFDDRVRVLSDFTSDRYRLRDAIQHTRPGSGTALYDAVDLVINQKLETLQGRKAIVLFTDGVDTTSKYASYESTIRDAEELDALIYSVEFDTSSDPYGGGGGGGIRVAAGLSTWRRGISGASVTRRSALTF